MSATAGLPYGDMDSLLRENAALREELMGQWESNHVEHCSREWPHPEGKRCHWPLPEVLSHYNPPNPEDDADTLERAALILIQYSTKPKSFLLGVFCNILNDTVAKIRREHP